MLAGLDNLRGRVARARLAPALACGAALLLALGAASCGGSDGASGAARFAVASATLTFVDPSRGTDATPTSPVRSERTLVTEVHWPIGRATPAPLVVLSHGLRSHPSRFSHLLRELAANGYVAAAPAYPLTSSASPDGGGAAGDVVNQPADLSFVIDELLRASGAPEGPLSGAIDAARIGAIGSSLGAITTLGAAFNSCCRDARIDAVVSIAGFLFPYPGTFEVRGGALLLLHGDADDTIPYALAEDVYAAAAPPRWLVTLLGGGHDVAELGFDTQAPREDRFESFARILVDFLDAYLEGDPGAYDRLRSDAVLPGLTSLQVDAGARAR